MCAQVLRDACDACHKNKTKCRSSGGPCDNCRAKGSICQFGQRNKMGRPRVRSYVVPRTNRRQRMRRNSATHVSTQSEPDYTSQSLTPDDYDTISSIQLWNMSTSYADGSMLSSSNSTASSTSTWSPQSCGSNQLHVDSNTLPDSDASSYILGFTSKGDDLHMEDLFITGGNTFTPPTRGCAWNSPNQSSINSTYDHLELGSGHGSYLSAQSQLPHILFELRTISQTLKRRPSTEAQKNQILTLVSSLCDTIKDSKSACNSTSPFPSASLIILATTISVTMEIYAVLAAELVSACSSWSDTERPHTHAFLKFHSTVFAMDFHLLQLKDALDVAGLAAYDAHTTQLADHVHVVVKDLLRKWQSF